jgi:SAM-dependent methyltransferase
LHDAEIRKLHSIEDDDWWFCERRAILARFIRSLGQPGVSLDIGAATGGNSQVLKKAGWSTLALDLNEIASGLAHKRGLSTTRADAHSLPLANNSVDFVIALDVLEHLDDDTKAVLEIKRVLKLGGVTLISVPCDMQLWSQHDVMVGHRRRYSALSLTRLIRSAELEIDGLWNWNVLLRPFATSHRRCASNNPIKIPPTANRILKLIIATERYLPVDSLPGLSLMLRAHRET